MTARSQRLCILLFERGAMRTPDFGFLVRAKSTKPPVFSWNTCGIATQENEYIVSSNGMFYFFGNFIYTENGFIVYTNRFSFPVVFQTVSLPRCRQHRKYTIKIHQTVAIVKKAAVFLYNPISCIPMVDKTQDFDILKIREL